MAINYLKPSLEDGPAESSDEGEAPSMGSFLTDKEFNGEMDRIIPPLDPALGAKQIIRDNMFTPIAEKLQRYGKGEWSLRPRIFAILRMLGCTELIDTFVREKIQDFSLPFNASNLPAMIRGEAQRTRFLELQNLVRPLEQAKDLETSGKHVEFRALADEYFRTRGPLGQVDDTGANSVVDHVYSSLSLRQYARKRTFVRGKSDKENAENLAAFKNDLNALTRLSHRHIVRFIGSYTDSRYFGIIMTPVADADLEVYLNANDDKNTRKQHLRVFFGCLATAIGYLHQHNMCHEDLKPRNVLVKGGNVLLTDFGSARLWEDDARSTTSSIVACTIRYSAPEVLMRKPRGRSSDIWSLGCIFLEMAAVLNNSTVAKMREFYDIKGTLGRHYWTNPQATVGWIQQLKRSFDVEDDIKPLEWVSWMLKEDPMERPKISQLQTAIIDSKNKHLFICRGCLSDARPTNGTDTPKASRFHGPIDGGGSSIVKRLLSDQDGIVTADMLGLKERPPIDSREGILHHNIADENNIESPGKQQNSPTLPTLPTLREPRISPKGKEKIADDQANKVQTETSSSTIQDVPEAPRQTKTSTPSISRTQSKSSARVRFGVLPSGRRPAPSTEPLDEDDENISFPLPEPLKPPPLYSKDCIPLPVSTLSPSYILAGTNRFSREEIRATKRNSSTSNLFVYGGLTFPAILRAIAAKSLKGVYSPIHQRRLYPSSTDWAKADVSIKNACETMTPALLKGFDRWRVSHLDWAVMQDSRMTRKILRAIDSWDDEPVVPQPPGEVVGFLVVGLTGEALRYCDMLFSSDLEVMKDPSILDKSDDSSSSASDRVPDPSDRPLQRQNVTVDVELSDGSIILVDALTYVWSHGIEDIRGLWSPERFLQGPKMGQLLGKDSAWRDEEQALASTMKISYALTGDYLCSSITTNDLPELRRLLQNHFDPNGPCRVYGSPLQAAACLGSKRMVKELLKHGADANLEGGRYRSPLIAATIASRKGITEMLLNAKANVQADGGIYVNALYQAVGHSDLEIAEVLLEHGAWLSENFREIRDLALEQNDTEMQDLLAKYDLRDHCRRALASSRRRELTAVERYHGDGQMMKTSAKVLTAVMKKVLVLQTDPGNWKGHKLVSIIKVALEAGAPPVILEYIRSAMEPVAMLIEVLRDKDRQEDNQSRRAIADVPREERSSEDSSSGEESERTRPHRRHPGSNSAGRRTNVRGNAKPKSQRESRIRWSDLHGLGVAH